MKDQIYKIIETEGITPAKFADEIGVQRSSISHILSGRNKPSYDFIVKILTRFSGINAEWLLTGKGNMIKSTQNVIKNESVQQNSLFDNPINSVKKDTKYKTKDSETDIPVNLDKEQKLITESSTNSSNNSEFTNVNNVKFIILLYEDGSFEKFNAR